MKDAGVCHDIFSEQALNTIYELTEGVPRIINNICSATVQLILIRLIKGKYVLCVLTGLNVL